MPSHSRRDRNEPAPGTAPERPAPAGLPEASVEQTGNEDPGSELTELQSPEPPASTPRGSGPGGQPADRPGGRPRR